MRTRTIVLQGNCAEADQFSALCRKSRALRNTANFYIRNTMTGLSKDEADRTPNERKVLEAVTEGLTAANRHKDERLAAAFRKLFSSHIRGMKAHAAVAAAFKAAEHFRIPDRENWFLGYNQLDAVFKETGNPDYRALPAQVNQQCIRKTVGAWLSYFAALKKYAADPGSFTGRPGIPGYIRGEAACAFTNQTARLSKDGGSIRFTGLRSWIKIGVLPGKYVKAELCPYHGAYRLLVTYEDCVIIPDVPGNPERILGIDQGVKNFAAVAGNFGKHPFLIRGTALKSRNQWFNKERARLVSELTRGKDSSHSAKDSHALDTLSLKRDEWIRDFFYKAAHYICRYAEKNSVDVIVAGHNERQKDSIRLGKAVDQEFVSIPFARFLTILRMVAASYGIPVVVREESYTSIASCLDMDGIPVYGEYGDTKPVFSGKRVKRGLYRSGSGILINADVNGAANILRKEYGYAFQGQDLSYLHRSTDVVGYHDIYPAQRRFQLKKRYRRPSIVSRHAHEQRSARRTGLYQAFNATKENSRLRKTKAVA